MAVKFCLCLVFLLTSSAAPPTKTFDQRQDGSLNIHAQLENVIVVLVPTSGISLVDLAKSRPNRNSLLQLLGKTAQNIVDKDSDPIERASGLVEDNNDISSTLQSKSSSVSESIPLSSSLESKNDVESPVLVLNSKPTPSEVSPPEKNKENLDSTSEPLTINSSTVLEDKLTSLSSASDTQNEELPSTTAQKPENSTNSSTTFLKSDSKDQTSPVSIPDSSETFASELESSPNIVPTNVSDSENTNTPSVPTNVSDSENTNTPSVSTNSFEPTVLLSSENKDQTNPSDSKPNSNEHSTDKENQNNELLVSSNKLKQKNTSLASGVETKITKENCLTNQLSAFSKPVVLTLSQKREPITDSDQSVSSEITPETSSKIEVKEDTIVPPSAGKLADSTDPSTIAVPLETSESTHPDVPAAETEITVPKIVVAESPSISLKNEVERGQR